MDQNKNLIDSINSENNLTRLNRAIYHKLLACQVPAMIAAKPAYNLAQMYIQAHDFGVKVNDLVKLVETTDIAEKILEMREAVKSLRHFADQFGRGYYVLMDKLTALTEGRLDMDDEDVGGGLDSTGEFLDSLGGDDLQSNMRSEIEAHTRQQFSSIVKRLISKGCPEDVANYFTENLFELKHETDNMVALVNRLITVDGDYENMLFDVEETIIELSIPWVGFSPGETAHALWHIGDHDEDNFFFMGFLGWSLAVLENLQENLENI
ncbi:MAG: hypothetical protein K6T91_06220 [Firmicutes bacterium]|nr:hypothetical protein [Bacillota bacterium]